MDDSDVINFLLTTEIIPLCLRIMEVRGGVVSSSPSGLTFAQTGSELSKTVATFIVQKILLDDMGLQYICATAEVLLPPSPFFTLRPSLPVGKQVDFNSFKS